MEEEGRVESGIEENLYRVIGIVMEEEINEVKGKEWIS